MKKVLKVVAIVLAVAVLGALGFYLWAGSATNNKLAKTYTVHTVDFPIPFPLDSLEVRRLRLTPARADSAARARAMERGQHLVEARYVCVECHGRDFSGGTMVDVAPLGRLLGPNLTSGKGSKTAGYTAADWDRIVRHGVRKDGKGAVMPSVDFEAMSDQELSDVITYVASFPAIDNEVAERSFGPVGKILVATNQLKFSADMIPADQAHTAMPPAPAVTVEFGKHMANICTGCHQKDLAGGPIVGGDPAWPPAKNLTQHESALKSWSLTDFVTAMREAKRPDGTMLQSPMSTMPVYAQKMTDVELAALWEYLKSVPPLPDR